MSVTAETLASRLQLRLIHGYDEHGDPIIRTRTFSNLKVDADVNGVYEVAQNLAGLQEHALDMVRRVDDVELVESE